MNKRILFYISGHGFGHATRMLALISEMEQLPGHRQLFIRSNVPEWIFRDGIKSDFHYCPVHIDTGTYQHDFIHLDKKRSFIEYEKLITRRARFLPSEVTFIRENNIGLIVGDIPPAAFYIAHHAGIKSVAVGNFSWDWIFEPYLSDYPEYTHVIQDMKRGYGYADLLLRLPFAGEFSSFRNITDIPLLVRKPVMSTKEIRDKLGMLTEQRPVILCSFGGFSTKNFDLISTVSALKNYFFIGFGPIYARGDNYAILPYQSHIDHPALVAMSDMVVSKLGYGTVAECVATGTPIMYIERSDFKEYPVLVAGIEKYLGSYLIPEPDFFTGNWQEHLDLFFTKISGIPKQVLCPVDGGRQAAKIICGF